MQSGVPKDFDRSTLVSPIRERRWRLTMLFVDDVKMVAHRAVKISLQLPLITTNYFGKLFLSLFTSQMDLAPATPPKKLRQNWSKI